MIVAIPAVIVLLSARPACCPCGSAQTHPTVFAMMATAPSRKPMDWHWLSQVLAASGGTDTSSAPTFAIHAEGIKSSGKSRIDGENFELWARIFIGPTVGDVVVVGNSLTATESANIALRRVH